MRGVLGTLLFAGLMLLMVRRRIRYIRTRQRIKPVRMALRLGVMSLIGSTLLLLPWTSAPLLLGAAALGVALAVYALTRTEFEHGEDGFTYQQKSYVGLVVFALFMGRMIWRFADRIVTGRRPGAGLFHDPGVDPQSTPVTLVLLFVVIGYAVCYTTGVLIRSRARRPA